MDQFVETLLFTTPIWAVLSLLALGLLFLRLVSRRKADRMKKAEQEMTGIGSTTWDSYQGPPTR